jgi:long-subunit acyl-CoA synthetase (AMP-forming)
MFRPALTASCGARGYAVMKGYYKMPDATAAAITKDGWLRSGDQASIDGEGRVRITGRIKDIIIRGGENIAPKEVEDVLRTHPAIADASVYAVASEFFGEEVARRTPPTSRDSRSCRKKSRRSAVSGLRSSRCRASSRSSRRFR